MLIACVNRRYDDRFPGEFRDRLRVKSRMPLGEGRLRALIRAREQRRRGGRADQAAVGSDPSDPPAENLP